jgi:hypothetical protein
MRVTLQYLGDEGEVGEVGEYLGDDGDIWAGAMVVIMIRRIGQQLQHKATHKLQAVQAARM